MQYFKPLKPGFFAGDCMPFFHDGTFHLFYLLDENHHGALGGLGGHQWAHATSADLVNWTHHPLAIAITDEWECSICTGSVFFNNGTFHGFYATRRADWTQHLSLATSQDCITFHKIEPKPLASPPTGYNPLHYRDPFVFWDEQTQRFHMLVTAMLDDYPLHDLGGCLAHLTSPDLKHWDVNAPFLIPGFPGAPECSDYFHWRGWYYLIFSNDFVTRYRMSRQPFGPWLRPKSEVLGSPAMRVMKTAPFTGNRRIGAAWIGTREQDLDTGRFQWGGHIVLREIIQHADGTLGTKFIPETVPSLAETVALTPVPLTAHATTDLQGACLDASQGTEAACVAGIPNDIYLTARVSPAPGSALFGLRLKGTGDFQSGYDLCFRPFENRVDLLDQTISCVDGLDRPFGLEIVLKGDIIDVCIDQRRCLINRCPELQGDALFLFARDAGVTFDNLEIRRFGS
jgi:beta-fructofuranosidase